MLLARGAIIAALLALGVACTTSTEERPAPSPPPTATVTGVTAAAAETPSVAVALSDPTDAAEAQRRLEAAGYRIQGPDGPAALGVTDIELNAADVYVLSSWALIVHTRAPVLDLTLAEARDLLSGTTGDWSQLVPSESPAPLRLLAPPAARAWLSRMSSTAAGAPGSVQELPLAEVLERIAAEPRAIGLVPVEALDLSVRALTVEGYDPYRDPVRTNPLADRRWITAPTADEAAAVAEVLGWANSTFDPAGILVTGELIPARCTQAALADAEGGFDVMFEGTRDLLAAADLAIASWEPAIVDDTPTPCTATFNMSTVPEAASATARAGIDVALAVGNHTGDCWTGCGYADAVMETLEHLRASGMVAVGAGEDLADARRPALVEVDGITFAILAYDEVSAEHYGAHDDTPGTNPFSLETLADDVRAARALADHVIAGFSWGVEYTADPTERQRQAARIAIEAGASLVVGNHPHWVQATEQIAGGFVAYGLGNFVFDQDWSVETTQGAVLEVGFTRERILGVRLRPTTIRERHLVDWVPVACDEGRAILKQSWDASDRLIPIESPPG